MRSWHLCAVFRGLHCPPWTTAADGPRAQCSLSRVGTLITSAHSISLYCHGKENIPLTGYSHVLITTFLLQSCEPSSRSHRRYWRAICFIWWRSASLAKCASARAILAWASSFLRDSFSSMSWNDTFGRQETIITSRTRNCFMQRHLGYKPPSVGEGSLGLKVASRSYLKALTIQLKVFLNFDPVTQNTS